MPTGVFCISQCARTGENAVIIGPFSSIFPKQPRFILYISQPAGILDPSFKSTRIQHEIICKSIDTRTFQGLILTLQD
ncbi:Uncharacterised protein [Kluyvera cryocrescens]|uniref:Uncharacterized protein n=1 Tax=Kluyvera cryocrescens TaxID=580 RepID=A0A485AL57_KLUCR|nr:Uncharacterised protein [Kluyvera cryocrescens]